MSKRKDGNLHGTDMLCRAVYKREARPADYLGGSDAPMLFDAAKEIHVLRQRIAELEGLVETLLENDPNDYAADAVTVLDVWRKEARRALGKALEDG